MQKRIIYRSLLHSVWALLAVCLFTSAAKAQAGAETGIPIQRDFLPSEYKANQQNFAVTSDQRGLVYVANFAGVLEFDGSRWRDILTADRTKVNALATDKQGRVFVGTRGEVGYLKPDSTGDMKFVSLNKYLIKAKIHDPDVINCFTNNAGAWFITADHIMLWNGKNFQTWAVVGKILSAFMVNGNVYLGLQTGGLKLFANGQLQPVNGGNIFSGLVTVNAMVSTGSGALIGSNQGVFTLDGRGVTKLITKADSYFSDNIITCATTLHDGTYAFGTVKGGIVVISADGMLHQVYSKKTSGLYSNAINYLYMDDNHGLWVAMQNGITRIETPSFLNFYNQLKNVNGDVNTAIRFNGQLYLATDQGVLVYDDSDLHFKPLPGLGMAASHMAVYNDNLIIATANGVYTYNGANAQKVADGYSLFVYADGNTVYIGRLDGVSVLKNEGGQLISNGKLPGVTDEIRGIAKDQAGNLWLQQPSKGLYKYNLQTQKAVLYDKSKGLPYSSGNYLNITSQGLLVGTLKGVYSYNPGNDAFQNRNLFKTDSARNNNWISKIVEDNEGNIWTTAGDGTNVNLYKKVHGKYMASSSALLPVQDQQIFSIYPDKQSGKVWLGSTDNLISYNANVSVNLNTIKPALIRSVTLNGDSLLFNGAYPANSGVAGTVQNDFLKPVLNFEQNNLLFTFSSPSSIERNDTRYQYFLEGFDADSSQWVTDKQKEYSNLPPGDYTFHVRAKNIFGVISPGAAYAFTINKPYYQTIGAYLVYGIILTVLMVLFMRVRSKQLLEETKKLEELINERTEEVVLQKQEIENQSAELANKNDELEKINLIVKSINAEINFNSLMQSILEKTRVIRGAEKAAMLVRDKDSGLFRFKASFGYDKKILETIQLTLEEAETRYLSFAEEAYEDIFFIKTVKSIDKDKLFSNVNKAKSALMMIVRLHGQIEAFMILENWQRQSAFVQRDFSLLKNLKEHFIAAFIKTTLLEEVQNALTDLKETQDQLIRQEKLASIGQLTKGIVDRILNPLNYINNFSLLSKDLIDESEELVEKPEISTDDKEEVLDILNTVKINLQKVNDHGVSASRIVKGMEKILREKSTDYIETDINKLISTNVEGMSSEFRKEHPDIKVDIVTDFDKKQEKYKILPAEMNTVLYNLLSNAFYEVIEKSRTVKEYEPLVKVSTKLKKEGFEIRIWDNGNGILDTELKQLFSPFFTTKPTAKGTGLGLYMSQDIIKEHKGNITVDTKVNEYTEFIIVIPKKP